MGKKKGGLEIEIVEGGQSDSDVGYLGNVPSSGEWMLGDDMLGDDAEIQNGSQDSSDWKQTGYIFDPSKDHESQLKKQGKRKKRGGNIAAKIMLATALFIGAAYSATLVKRPSDDVEESFALPDEVVTQDMQAPVPTEPLINHVTPLTQKVDIPSEYPSPELLDELGGLIEEDVVALDFLMAEFLSKHTRRNPQKKEVLYCKQEEKNAILYDLEERVFVYEDADCNNFHKIWQNGVQFYMSRNRLLVDDKAGKEAHIKSLLGPRAYEQLSWVVEQGPKGKKQVIGTKKSGVEHVQLGDTLRLFKTDAAAEGYAAKHGKEKKRVNQKRKRRAKKQRAKSHTHYQQPFPEAQDVHAVLAAFNQDRGEHQNGDVYCVIRAQRKNKVSYQVAKREGSTIRMYSQDGTAQGAVPFTVGLQKITQCRYNSLHTAQRAAGYKPRNPSSTQKQTAVPPLTETLVRLHNGRKERKVAEALPQYLPVER